MKNALSGIGAMIAFIATMIISVLIPVVIIAMGISLYNNWQGNDTEPTNSTSVNQNTGAFENESKRAFVEECSEGDAPGQREYCQCVWNEIRKTHSLSELSRDGLNLTEQQIMDKYSREIFDCIDYLEVNNL